MLFNNAEIRFCGQKGGVRAAIKFQELSDRADGSYIKNTSIHDSYLNALHIDNTNKVLVENNVIYKSEESTIKVFGADNIIKGKIFILKIIWFLIIFVGNLALYTTARPKTSEEQIDLLATYEIRGGVNTIIGNVAVGSDDMGFVGKGSVCGTTYANAIFKDNIAVACEMGFYFQKNPAGGCISLFNLIAFKNRHLGVFLQQSTSAIFTGIRVSDTSIGISLNHANLGIENFFALQDVLVVGKSGIGGCEGTNTGFYGSSFGTGEKGLPPMKSDLPWEKVKTDPCTLIYYFSFFLF